ncbi:MAG: hypothetical protein ACAF41_09490 [Leptolyngbya sp. BL-A-14]
MSQGGTALLTELVRIGIFKLALRTDKHSGTSLIPGWEAQGGVISRRDKPTRHGAEISSLLSERSRF